MNAHTLPKASSHMPKLGGFRVAICGTLLIGGLVCALATFLTEASHRLIPWLPTVLVAALAGPGLVLLGLTVARRRYGVPVLVLTMFCSALLATCAWQRMRTSTASYGLYGLSFALLEAEPGDMDALIAITSKQETIRLFGPCFDGLGPELDIERIEVTERRAGMLDVTWSYYNALHAHADLPYHVAITYWHMKLRWFEMNADPTRMHSKPEDCNLIGWTGTRFEFNPEGIVAYFEHDLRRYVDDPRPFLEALAERDADARLRAAVRAYLDAHPPPQP